MLSAEMDASLFVYHCMVVSVALLPLPSSVSGHPWGEDGSPEFHLSPFALVSRYLCSLNSSGLHVTLKTYSTLSQYTERGMTMYFPVCNCWFVKILRRELKCRKDLKNNCHYVWQLLTLVILSSSQGPQISFLSSWHTGVLEYTPS